ncbi:unknown protein [Microcystis aeruginosa NIES-843]|uniref:Uncharacterized protein n=1 Tax=Microcystis aeruginosa (strain NIES-843 / IAM M-2473) TaxID=449447 RepID=B0JKP1_MICAN|nr:unknown protein [Microcystis aeruginosa NIES-843]
MRQFTFLKIDNRIYVRLLTNESLTAKKGVGKTKLPAAPCLFPDLPRSDTIKRLSWKN